MRTRLVLVLAVLAIAATLLSFGRSSDGPEADPVAQDRAGTSSNGGVNEACLTDFSYRARFAEKDPATGDVLVELLHEVEADQARVQASNGSGLLLLGTQAWSYDSNEWNQLDEPPIRPLRVPWVNNFVTAEELVDRLTFVDSGEVAQGLIAARIYRPTLDEMIDAFDDRFEDRQYDPATSSFEYWIDACDQAVFADITLTFAGEAAETARVAEIPLTLRYTYEAFDVDRGFAEQQPEGTFEPIPRPAES